MIRNKTCLACRQPIASAYRDWERERSRFKVTCKTCRRAYTGPQRNKRYWNSIRRARTPVRPGRSKRRGLGQRSINRKNSLNDYSPDKMDPEILEWLDRRSLENLIITFRSEIVAVSKGASPDGLLPTGPRRRLLQCGVFRLIEGRDSNSCAGRALKLTPKGEKLLALTEENPYD